MAGTQRPVVAQKAVRRAMTGPAPAQNASQGRQDQQDTKPWQGPSKPARRVQEIEQDKDPPCFNGVEEVDGDQSTPAFQ
jgi:hypothetical protein